MGLFSGLPDTQAGFAFPASLAEKYRPRTFADFVGLDKPKRILAKFADAPCPCGLFFVGDSGTGKTSMALALCEAIRGELHHVPSQQCNVENLDHVVSQCHYVPNTGKSFHVVLVDEAHKMTNPAQLSLLSRLDGTRPAPNTIFVFTATTTDGLDSAFLSRLLKVPFQSHGIAEQTASLLERIWEREAGAAEKPNFLRIVRDSQNNVRNALNTLQTEILAA
jgi:replication-associated recombination protein RarA